MSEKALVFISCGQITDAEKKLGQDVADLVNAQSGLKAYLAENQSSAAGLTNEVFRALDRAAGFIAIMHQRGDVTTRHGKHVRASVWIEQEIAIVAFMRDVRGDEIETLSYTLSGIKREGIRDKIILNPRDVGSDADVLADLKTKLAAPEWQQLQPKRPKVPRMAVDIGFTKLPASDGNHHNYETKIVITNVSDVLIEDYLAVLSFPRRFILSNALIMTEQKNEATETHRIFHEINHSGVPLRPTKTRQILRINYDMTDDLYSKYSHGPEFSEPVSVQVFVKTQLAGNASKPFKDVQIF